MRTPRPFLPALAVLAALVLLALPAAAAERYEIDPVHSSVSFKIRHLGISSVTGSFTEFSGSGSFDAERPEASSIEVTVQAASVNTSNNKRDAHLRSEDFFNVAKFPTLTFKSTSVKKVGDNRYAVTGDFTMLGVTKPVTVTVEDLGPADGMKGEKRRGGETTFKIKRSDWGMRESIGPVGDEVQVTLAFSGIQK